MIIGITGSRDGCTQKQRVTLRTMLLECTELHHGDCIGVDEDAHIIAFNMRPKPRIVIHPPLEGALRAYCKGDEVLFEHDYITRNHHIVDACEHLLACPASFIEKQRSGTWATIRYARSINKRRSIIYPDGVIRSDH